LYEIVGVWADIVFSEPRDRIEPVYYTAFAQNPLSRTATFEVKVDNSAGVIRQIRSIVGSFDSALAVTDVRT